MSNTILTPTIYTKEALRILENNLVFSKNVTRKYEDKFANEGAKIGYTINVQRPARFTVSSGANLSTQDYTGTSLPVTITTQAHVDTTFSTADLTLSLDAFSDKILKPSAAALANVIDFDGLTNAMNTVGNHVGTPGTTPATAAAVLAAGQKLDEMAAPRTDRSLVFNPAAQASLINAFTGFFAPQTRIAGQYNDGVFVDMSNTLGFKMGMDQNVQSHTVGPLGGTPLVNGASQGITSGWANTTSLVTDGWTASAASRLKKGDIFTIASVNAVNPQNRTSTGALQQFVVTADVSSDGSGNLTAVISPAIISAGAFQNVSAAPADNAALTIVGTAATAYPRNMAYHKDAFALACVDLQDVGKWGAESSRQSHNGISLRVVRQYAIATDTAPCRMDVLYGWATLYQELACQVSG